MDRRVIFIKGSKLYGCSECPETSKRRFNVERHMKRFHERNMNKMCCGKTFYTKSEFYDHREKKHGEKKRYAKKEKFSARVIKDENSSSFEEETTIEQKTENSCREFSKTQANNEFSPICEKLSVRRQAPKKYFLSQWKKNSEILQLKRQPFTNIENNIENVIGRKTAMKRAARKQIKVKDSSLNKENVKIYNVTDYSREGIDKGLKSIKF